MQLDEGGEDGVDLAFGGGLQDGELHPFGARRFLKVLECVEGDEFVDDLAAFHDRSQHIKAYRYVCDRSAEPRGSSRVEDYLASDDYLDELRATAVEVGVDGARVLDGRRYSYPHIVRIEARDLAVRIGKKKETIGSILGPSRS